jgi:hypothetical protein
MSEVDHLLKGYLAEGKQESEGHFSINPRLALEKLAASRLPSPGAWALKLVQSAVAGGATSLRVTEEGNLISFEFESDSRQNWPIEQFESLFFDPGRTEWRSLDHLKHGLWAVALHHEFLFIPADSPLRYSWNGQELKAIPGQMSLVTVIRLSTMEVVETEEPRPHGLLAELRFGTSPVQRPVHVLHLDELQSRAHLCPIPLMRNGRRLDRLQIGCEASQFPLRILAAHAEVPQLGFPPGTPLPPNPYDGNLGFFLTPNSDLPAYVGVAGVLMANIQLITRGRRDLSQDPIRRIAEAACRLHWVLDGVIVETRELGPRGQIACELFASAEGLMLDLSGFKVADSPAAAERQRLVCEAITASIAGTALPLDIMNVDARQRATRQANWFFLTALCTLFLGVGVILVPLALVNSLVAMGATEPMVKGMQKSLLQLQSNWQSSWPVLSDKPQLRTYTKSSEPEPVDS